MLFRSDARYAVLSNLGACDHCKSNWLASQAGNDVKKAAEALQLFKHTQKALDFLEEVASDSIIAECSFFKAHSDGDNIVLDDSGITIPTLRQQKDKETTLSLSDFISPEEDYIVTFAVTVGEQIQNIVERKRNDGDDYTSLIYQTLADRLVEAATELLHKRVRTEFWGYSEEENCNIEDIINEKYKGIRPAIGYPSLPDQSIIFDVDKLMPLSNIGITLTENGAMYPNACVCGLMISHPQSEYFYIGNIGADQRADYAKRKGLTEEEITKWLVL